MPNKYMEKRELNQILKHISEWKIQPKDDAFLPTEEGKDDTKFTTHYNKGLLPKLQVHQPFSNQMRDRLNGYDNPRYRIPAARALGPLGPLGPRAMCNKESKDQAIKKETNFPSRKVDSLPVSILDIAHASLSSKTQGTSKAFNIEDDVKRFRKLFHSSPQRSTYSDSYKQLHVNYCNRDKTERIITWIQNVNEIQNKTDMFSDTDTEFTSMQLDSSNRNCNSAKV